VRDYASPQFDSIALVSIDMQRDLLDGEEQEVVGTSAAARVIADLCDAFRHVGAPIVHIVRLYREDGSNADACRRGPIEDGLKLVIAGSPGAEIAGELVPQGATLDTERLLAREVQELGSNEVAIYKPRWGAFYDTPLEAHLRRVGVSSLAFCGCNFPNCPRTSIYEASERNFRVVVVENGVSGIYDRGRDELRAIGARLMTGEEIAASLRRAAETAWGSQ
jgi:nicotinamidase-related amidase